VNRKTFAGIVSADAGPTKTLIPSYYAWTPTAFRPTSSQWSTTGGSIYLYSSNEIRVNSRPLLHFAEVSFTVVSNPCVGTFIAKVPAVHIANAGIHIERASVLDCASPLALCVCGPAMKKLQKTTALQHLAEQFSRELQIPPPY